MTHATFEADPDPTLREDVLAILLVEFERALPDAVPLLVLQAPLIADRIARRAFDRPIPLAPDEANQQ